MLNCAIEMQALPHMKILVRRGQEQVLHWCWLYSQFLIFTASLC